VTTTVEQLQLGAFPRGDVGKEAGAFGLRGADLEMRIARAAQGACAEERTAEVRTATATTREHALRRSLERSVRAVEHAGPVQRLVRVGRAFDVELVARRPAECVLLICPYLGVDVECAQQRERAARDCGAREIEVQRDLAATAQVHAARHVEQA